MQIILNICTVNTSLEGKMRIAKRPCNATKRSKARKRPSFNKKRQRKTKAEAADTSYDVEDLLIKTLALRDEKGTSSLLLPRILHNLSGSMKQIAYRHGFASGRSVYDRAGGVSISPLLKILKNAGLGDVLYSPTEHKIIIKSTGAKGIQLNTNVHIYESGIIAGYLSAHTSMLINTRETSCMHNNSEFCQFVADYGIPPKFEEISYAGQMLEAVENSVKNKDAKAGEGSPSYYLLLLSPLIKQADISKAADLLLLSGKRLAKVTDPKEYKETLKEMARLLGATEAAVAYSTKGKKRITVKYAAYSSIDKIVELSIQMVVGFFTTMFKSSDVSVEKGIGKDKAYIVNVNINT